MKELGTYIETFVEVKRLHWWVDNNETSNQSPSFDLVKSPIFTRWKNIMTPKPFIHQNYNVYGFLAGVRNLGQSDSFPVRGLPNNSNYLNYHFIGGQQTNQEYLESTDAYSFSYLTLEELLLFDYTQTFENRRGVSLIDGNNTDGTVPEGEGKMMSYETYLGSPFIRNLEELKQLGNPVDVRIVFWFNDRKHYRYG